MQENEPVGSLLRDALDGDREAWVQIVDRHSRLLWWVVRRLRIDETTGADVVQTVWLQLIQHGHAIRDADRLPQWLAVTARRECLRRLARSQRELPSEELVEAADPTGRDVDESLLDDETIAEALVAFHRISPACRRLLALLLQEPPLPYTEVAALLGKSTGYIGPTRARCLAQLRSHMQAVES